MLHFPTLCFFPTVQWLHNKERKKFIQRHFLSHGGMSSFKVNFFVLRNRTLSKHKLKIIPHLQSIQRDVEKSSEQRAKNASKKVGNRLSEGLIFVQVINYATISARSKRGWRFTSLGIDIDVGYGCSSKQAVHQVLLVLR